ncbi:hypothetical protein OE88DRAFT_1436621 [Heliocybe sulcata]|uniref:DUF5745 domain-containing protein n=1 Tax=Heliocybe sulcata TaxID=5364 RepID=A0A5C3N9N2_9AGAM|nr:hypothetical protein OE88DRAFT_1436621 [Heliocybe sulcata]
MCVAASIPEGDLVDALNTLLAALHLPFILVSPSDLIPSLLLAILESILRSRLPIPADIRESRTSSDKIQAMKIFLGVLESDIIGENVGLSDMDPRRLAAGEHEEVVFVAEVLCWLGTKRGLGCLAGSVPSNAQVPPMDFVGRARPQSPFTHTTITGSPHTTYSFQGEVAASASDTTCPTVSASPTNTESTILEGPDRNSVGTSRRSPMCIHEIDEPSFLAEFAGRLHQHRGDATQPASTPTGASSTSHCDSSFDETRLSGYPQAAPFRRSGLLDEVDIDTELKSFESSKLEGGCSTPRPRKSAAGVSYDLFLFCYTSVKLLCTQGRQPSLTTAYSTLTKHNSPNQHRLALLNERARLLSELASLKLDDPVAGSPRPRIR